MDNAALSQALEVLSPESGAVARALRDTALLLGCGEKVCPPGKKDNGVKIEYILKKPRRTLFTLRICGSGFSIVAKLFHLEAYQDALADCTGHCKASLLEASGACGYHLGRCPGPVNVPIDGVAYPKCRHSLVFAGILPEDVPGIQGLLAREAEHCRQG